MSDLWLGTFAASEIMYFDHVDEPSRRGWDVTCALKSGTEETIAYTQSELWAESVADALNALLATLEKESQS